MIERQKTGRPFLVTVIALFLIARAVLILLATFSPWTGQQLALVPRSAVQVVTLSAFTFFVPRAESSTDLIKSDAVILGILTVPVAIYFAYVGVGLLLGRSSARMQAAVWSLLTVLVWIRGLLFASAFNNIDQRYFTSAQTKSNIILALFLNSFVFLYLLYGEGVAHSFGLKD